MESKINTPKVQANVDDSELKNAIATQHTRVFRERFPHSIEQTMRLISERLQRCLRDKDADNNQDVYHLSRSLDILYNIHLDTRC